MTLSDPTVRQVTATTAEVSVTTNESGGTMYWIVDANGTQPTAAQIKAGQNAAGSPATASGNYAVTDVGAQPWQPVSGLTALTTYYVWFVQNIPDAFTQDFQSAQLGPFTHTRASAATGEDYQGIVQTVGNDVPVFLGAQWTGSEWVAPPDGVAIGLQYELAATNRLNTDWSNAAWVKNNLANAGNTLTATAGNGTALQTYTAGAATRTFSVDIRRVTGTGDVQITVDGGTNWVTVRLLDSRQRFTLAATAANPQVGIRIVTSGDAVEATFPQLEDTGYATSRTDGTRALPRVQALTTAIPDLPDAGLTNNFCVQFVWQAPGNGILGTSDNRIFELTNAAGGDAVTIRGANSTTGIRYNVWRGGATVLSAASSVAAVEPGEIVDFRFRYSSTQGLHFWQSDKGLIRRFEGTATGQPDTLGMTTITLGDRIQGGRPYAITPMFLRIVPQDLSDAEIESWPTPSMPGDGTSILTRKRMTSDTVPNATMYHLTDTMSPDGQRIALQGYSSGGDGICRVVDLDGANYKRISDGSETTYNGHCDGAWHYNGDRYYLHGGTFYANVSDQTTGRLETVTDAYWPRISPDNTKIAYLNYRTDDGNLTDPEWRFYNLATGALIKTMPIPFDTTLDVSYGWFGPDHLWFLTGSDRRASLYVDYATGTVQGDIRPDGVKMLHRILSEQAYRLGPGLNTGRIAGHNPKFDVANVDVESGSRQIQALGNRQQDALVPTPQGTHSKFTRDGRYLCVENDIPNVGVLSIFDLQGTEPSYQVCRFRDAERIDADVPESWREYPQPHWSLDGTKLYWHDNWTSEPTTQREVYTCTVRLPDAPTDPVFNAGAVTFQPGARHYETNEYLLFRDGTLVSNISARKHYIDIAMTDSSTDAPFTSIPAHIDGFEYFEVEAPDGNGPNEIIRMTPSSGPPGGRTITRGEFGTTPSAHWIGARVWVYTGAHGFTGETDGELAVVAVEHSGLRSDGG